MTVIPESPGADLSIVVYKSERKLEVYRNKEKIHTFRVGLGFQPVGDKEVSGDGKTPEGKFYVCVKNPNSRFYLSLGLNYPDTEDARRGLRQNIISDAEYQMIMAANRKKGIPPWNTRLGGEIFIHGKGASSDWTLGCVALDDEEMKLLYEMTPVGTPVEIRK
ncbi:MAG: L,D-transpeptidase [Verrucomicrobiota bacterium]